MAYEIDLRENDICVLNSIAYILEEPVSEILPPDFSSESGPLSVWAELNALLNVKYNMSICFWENHKELLNDDQKPLWIAIVPCYGKTCSLNVDSHAIVMRGDKLEYDCEEQRKVAPKKMYFGVTIEEGSWGYNPHDVFGWYPDSEYLGKIEYKRWLTK